MVTEKVDFQLVLEKSEKKGITWQKFEPPKLKCGFCGRVTDHSADKKVCLVCGLIERS
jgi:hypothetical protein